MLGKCRDHTCVFALGSLAWQAEGANMAEESLRPNYDPASDEMIFHYPFIGEPDCQIRVPGSARVQADAWIRERIEGWFVNHPKPLPGTSVQIPGYQFEPTLFQPSRVIPRFDHTKRRPKGRPRSGRSGRGSGRSVGVGSSSVTGKKRPKRRRYRRIRGRR